VVALGEVGLAGDVRRVGGLKRRLAEAARLGFSTAFVPPGQTDAPSGMRIVEVTDLAASVRRLRMMPV
jgi:DNA repair protein RadA/Sms